MRIAFATNPAIGHLLPLVPLAQAARHAGHDVAIVGGASLQRTVRDAGLPLVVAGPHDLPSVFAQVRERDGLTGRRLGAITWRYAFAGVLAAALADGILELAASWRPDLVVHEDSEQGSWIAAERLGIPSIGLQATAWRGVRYRLSDDPLNRLRLAHGLPEDPGLRRWHRFGFLTTRPPGLRHPGDPMPEGTRPLRPATADAAGGEEAWWPEAGVGHRRVVVTMGTILPGRERTMVQVLDGLEQLDVQIVATVGNDLDPAVLGPRRATTRVARFVPLSALLDGSSLLVFHAGSGTMLASAAAGVPMVMLPVAADQPDNADRGVAAGVALAIALDDRRADAIRDAAARVLGDPGYAAAAAGMRDEIAAMPAPEALVPFLESLASP